MLQVQSQVFCYKLNKQTVPRLLLLPCDSFLEEILLGTLENESYLWGEEKKKQQNPTTLVRTTDTDSHRDSALR